MRILIVEDEVKVANALKQGFEDELYEVIVANTGEDAFFRINTEQFDVILLDVMLPGRDGLQILAGIRKQGIRTPVVLVTARDRVQDRVAGLNAGADDYVVKPKDSVRGTPLNNVIDVHIARLRRKLDLGQPSKLIHTVRGVGFVLREDEEEL